MITLAAGPDGTFPPGFVREVSDAEAAALIAGGYASAVEEPRRQQATSDRARQRETAAPPRNRPGAK